MVAMRTCFILICRFEGFYSPHREGHPPSFLLMIEIAALQNVACVLLNCPEIGRGDVGKSLESCLSSISMDIRWRPSSSGSGSGRTT